MGVFAGPKTTQDAPIFSIDGRNIKSFPNNGKIINSITQEERNTTATIQDGYIYSNNGIIEKFSNLPIENSSAITVNVSVDNTLLKSGTAFSICSDDEGSYRYSGITSYSTGIVTTTAISVNSYIGNYASSGITSYSTGIVTTTAISVNSYIGNYASSGITSYSTGIVTTTAISVNSYIGNYASSGITSYSTGIVTTTSTGISISDYNPSFELSCKLTSNNILVVNKNLNDQTYLIQELNNQEKDIYSIVFRTLGITSSPITLYKNGSLLASSSTKTGQSQFVNAGITIFSLSNGNHSQYGIGFLSVYNSELNIQEVQFINNLETR
jgi:hypothetical protein